MTSFMALDGVTSFLRLRDVTNTICFRRLLCIKIEIDQLQCVIFAVSATTTGLLATLKKSRTGTGKNKESNFSN